MEVFTQQKKNFRKMFNRSHIYISLALFTTFLVSCVKQIPSDVIEPSKMEDIIYDYNLANVMGDELQFNEYYKKELYNKYVFEKHNISSAQFDSSMLWYSKHADELKKIYKNVDSRFSKKSELIASATTNLNVKKHRYISGDTIDIWDKNSLIWLTPSDITNKILFSTKADTSFRANDTYIMEGDYQFLGKGKQNAVVGINLILDNDSVVGRTKEINLSGPNILYFNTNVSPKKVKNVNGFIYYKGDNKLSGMLVNNLSLLKIHSNKPATPANDSTSVPLTKEQQIVEQNTLDSIQKINSVDTTNFDNQQPLRNDPRSIRERTPRKIRQNIK